MVIKSLIFLGLIDCIDLKTKLYCLYKTGIYNIVLTIETS